MFAMLVFANSFAQTFNGVKIGGTIAQMKFKLEQKGFKTDEIKNNVLWMVGKMAGRNVMLGVVGSPKTKTVWKVLVILTDDKSWYDLKSEYFNTKDILTKKYGEPKDCYAFFSSPYYEGDGYEKQAVENDKCTYSCFYGQVEEGKLDLSVSISESFHVTIHYENVELSKLKKIETEQLEQSAF